MQAVVEVYFGSYIYKDNYPNKFWVWGCRYMSPVPCNRCCIGRECLRRYKLAVVRIPYNHRNYFLKLRQHSLLLNTDIAANYW
jgi:hypothetical protein